MLHLVHWQTSRLGNLLESHQPARTIPRPRESSLNERHQADLLSQEGERSFEYGLDMSAHPPASNEGGDSAYLAVEVIGVAFETANVPSIECADQGLDPLMRCSI